MTLLAPQATSDDGEPIIDIPTDIRIPIYTTRSYLIDDILTDISSATLQIDGDPLRDTDGNSISDDDFVSSGSGFAITSRDIVFGSFAVPGRYPMMIQARDAIGNTTTLPITVTAYIPVPQIQSVTT